jgi:hypothetical protein
MLYTPCVNKTSAAQLTALALALSPAGSPFLDFSLTDGFFGVFGRFFSDPLANRELAHCCGNSCYEMARSWRQGSLLVGSPAAL